MLALTDTDHVLNGILAGAPAANNPEFTVTYGVVDASGNWGDVFTVGGTFTDGSETIMLAAPASGKKIIRGIHVYNADTSAIVLSIYFSDGATDYRCWKATLGTLYNLSYGEDGHFRVFNASGVEQVATA